MTDIFALESGRRAASGEGKFVFWADGQGEKIMEEVRKTRDKPLSPPHAPASVMPPNSKRDEDSDELHLVDCDQYLTTETKEAEKEGGEYSYIVAHPEPRYLYENV